VEALVSSDCVDLVLTDPLPTKYFCFTSLVLFVMGIKISKKIWVRMKSLWGIVSSFIRSSLQIFTGFVLEVNVTVLNGH
jgi:hypothetical protein